MPLAAAVLARLAALLALLAGLPGLPGPPGLYTALAVPVPDHIHVVHRGPLAPHVVARPMKIVLPVQRRRIHLLDPRTALNLVNAHETRRRRGSKRPPPSYRGPSRPGPPRPPRWKGPPTRKGPPRDKPWMQATRGSSPAATRVRYRSKPPRKSKTSKTKSKGKGKVRPVVPPYADGYAEDDEVLRDPEDPDTEEDRPRKRPGKSTYPKGWGPDGGYRVPAPSSSSSPRYPPYGTDEDEPGTGHLDLEERFINQHNQFYRHGYPADSAEAAPTSTQSKKKPGSKPGSKPGYKPGYYEDEEIEVAEGSDGALDGLTASSTSSAKRQPSYRRPSSKKTKYSLLDGTLRDAEPDSREEEQDYHRRPHGGSSSSGSSSSSKGRGKKKLHDDRRHQSMYHAKFREQQDDRSLSAAHFNYELSGAASETAHTAVNNHRPAYDAEPGGDVKTGDVNFFRTRKPQYWG